jgi:hypothetical protein
MIRFLLALMLLPSLVLAESVTLDSPARVNTNAQFDVIVWNNTNGDSVTGSQTVISFDDKVLTYLGASLGPDLASPWQIQYVNPNYPLTEGTGNNRSISFQVYGGAGLWYQGNKRIAKVRFQSTGCGLNTALTVVKGYYAGGATQFVTLQLETHAVYNGKLTAIDDAVGTLRCGRGGGELSKPVIPATWQRVKGLYR